MKREFFIAKTDAALAVIVLMVAFYLCVCVAVLLNNRTKEANQTIIISNDRVKFELAHSYRHDAAFFRMLAERLQFSPHDPLVMQKCYETAILKGPSDYRNFLSYARYLTYKNCCQSQLRDLIAEAINRAPNDPRLSLEAGQLLLRTHQNEAALRYLNRAADLGARFTEAVYVDLAKNGLTLDSLNQITKRRPQSLLTFAMFLSMQRKAYPDLLRKTCVELSAMSLKPEQRITLGKLAYNAGENDLAVKQAQLAALRSESRLPALRLLSAIYYRQQNWDQYQQVMKTIEANYKGSGLEKKACEVAVQRLKINDRSGLRTQLMHLVSEYPDCAEAFYKLSQMANASRAEAKDYAQKAVAADPAEFRYSERLASLDLQMGNYDEAQEIYNHFLKSDPFSSRAYVGLAKCKESRGERSAAIALLKEGMQKSNNVETIWKELGRLYSTNGEYLPAADAYMQYAQLTSDKPEGFILAAEAYKKAGLPETARTQYEAALKIDGANQRAIAALKSLNEMSKANN